MSKSNVLVMLSVEKLVLLLVFLAPVCFLTIKGWINSISISLFLIAIFCILRDPNFFFSGRGKAFWVCFTILITPFLVPIFSQLLQSEFHASSLDAPSRFLMAFGAFILFSRLAHEKILNNFSLGCLIGLFLTFLQVIFFSEGAIQFWGQRAATFFVDPNNLGVYSVILLGVGLFASFSPRLTLLGYILKAVLAFAACYLVIFSGSRAALLALIMLAEVLLLTSSRKILTFLLGNVLLGVGLIVSLNVFPTFSYRLAIILPELFDGLAAVDYDTSIGMRVGSLRLESCLVGVSPLTGLSRAFLADFGNYRDCYSLVPPLVIEHYVLSGSHTEFTGAIVRFGIVLGAARNLALFVIPAFLFYGIYLAERGRNRSAGRMLLSCIAAIVAGGVGIQVLNLTMFSMFYGFLMAVGLGAYIRTPSSEQRN